MRRGCIGETGAPPGEGGRRDIVLAERDPAVLAEGQPLAAGHAAGVTHAVTLVAVDHHRADRARALAGHSDLQGCPLEPATQLVEQLSMLARRGVGLHPVERVLLQPDHLPRDRGLDRAITALGPERQPVERETRVQVAVLARLDRPDLEVKRVRRAGQQRPHGGVAARRDADRGGDAGARRVVLRLAGTRFRGRGNEP